MAQTYSIAEARKNLSKLLKKVRQHPELRVRITVNGIPMGDLVSPGSTEPVKKAPFKAKGMLRTRTAPSFHDFRKIKARWKDPLL